MNFTNDNTPINLAAWAFRALAAPAAMRAQASAAIVVGSKEHAQVLDRVLDRVARARCVEWLDREHGMDRQFARSLVANILDIYTDSTTVRR